MQILILDEHYSIPEVLNILFSLNSIIKHIEYLNNLFQENSFSYREYDENFTEKYMNFFQNREHMFLLNSYKTRPMEKMHDKSVDTIQEYGMKIFYKDKRERRRIIFIDRQGKQIY